MLELLFLVMTAMFEYRQRLQDIALKEDHPRIIPAKFALIWQNGFQEDFQ